MFGYVNVDKSNLSDEQFATYKGVYCTLCKTMGKEYSPLSRLALSYDCTFFAIFMLSLQDNEFKFCDGRCKANPLKKCIFLKEDNIALEVAAALSISTSYYKLLDNINDDNFFKSIPYRFLKLFFKRWNNKVKKKFPEIDKEVSKMLSYQIEVEQDANCIIDKACDPTAIMLQNVCSFIPRYIKSSKINNDTEKILKTFGYFLGRWIYLIDAVDDYNKDLKHKNFNPFIIKYKDNFKKEEALRTLNHSLSEIMLSYNLLNKGIFDYLISNVLFMGLPNKQRVILNIKENGETDE